LFAGPGGLGEGFLSCTDNNGNPLFCNSISIERDEFSHLTLTLRHFLRSFGKKGFPDEYYKYLEGEIALNELFSLFPKNYKHACDSSLRISLGPESHQEVRTLINKKLKNKKSWALIGGPPCQAYSLVGRSRMTNNPNFEEDERHFLYREYLKIIADHQPPVFVMENVKGLLSAKIAGEPVIDRILLDLAKPCKAIGGVKGHSYRLYSLSQPGDFTAGADPRNFIVKAEEYGVPQARHRMFIIGVRDDLDIIPQQLEKSTAPTVFDMIGNLPKIRSAISRKDNLNEWKQIISEFNLKKFNTHFTEGKHKENIFITLNSICNNADKLPNFRESKKYPIKPKSNNHVLLSLYDNRLSILTGHQARGHMPSDHHRYLFSAAFAEHANRSPKLSDFPEYLLPNHKNVDLGRSGKMFSDRFRVQLANQYSTTITSHISKDGHYFIHYDPSQCRSLTVREAARLQTFPDNYNFEGPRTSQYHQIGNAVPPYLAQQIAVIISQVLSAVKT